MRVTNNSKQNPQKALLKKYLSRYYAAREQQRILTDRLVKLKTELENGAAPRPGGRASGGRFSEIEKRIAKQYGKEEAALLDVMRLIDVLPDNSTEKIIMGLRYIDCKPWKDIAEQVHLSRSPCFAYYDSGLRMILKSKQAQKILASYGAKLKRAGKNE